MARAQRKTAPALAPTFDHNAIIRRWLAARTTRALTPISYTAASDLYEDYQAYTADAAGAEAVMPEQAFAETIVVWPRLHMEMLPVRRRGSFETKMALCVNLQLNPAIRAAS